MFWLKINIKTDLQSGTFILVPVFKLLVHCSRVFTIKNKVIVLS